MAGFGRSPFGRGPFGRSDTGYDLVQRRFPEEYFNPDVVPEFAGQRPNQNENDHLVKVLKTFSHSVQKRRIEIDDIQGLLDYDKAPLEIVRLFGEMLGLGIDKNDPEFLQRSFLGNASQWLQIKGSDKGYQVRGLASGFVVSVDNFWRIDPSYLSVIPPGRIYLMFPNRNVDPGVSAFYHTDAYPGEYVGTPLTEDETYAKSSYLRITFEVAEPRRPSVDYNALLDLAIDKIRDVIAIHHELFRVVFQIRVNVDASLITNDWMIEEHSIFNPMVQGVYDIEAADIHPTDWDSHLTVGISITP